MPEGRTPRLRLDKVEYEEQFGIIFVYDGLTEKPSWRPDIYDDGQWGPMYKRRFSIDTHPQEVTENGVDRLHFNAVHKFADVKIVEPFEAMGPHAHMAYSAERPIRGLPQNCFRYDVDIYGLGIAVIDISFVDTAITVRQLILTTPIDASSVDVTLAATVRLANHPLGSAGILRRSLMQRVLGKGVLEAVSFELHRDKKIWTNKTYLERPGLCAADGPIGKYRKWARQFYEA